LGGIFSDAMNDPLIEDRRQQIASGNAIASSARVFPSVPSTTYEAGRGACPSWLARSRPP
jgi:hypothetical protein